MPNSDCKSTGEDSVKSGNNDADAETSNNIATSARNNLTAFDVWALGITVVIGGQYFSWNNGLVAGFGSCCIAFALIGSAYLCLVLCIAEITSGLPFEGGKRRVY